MHNFLNLM